MTRPSDYTRQNIVKAAVGATRKNWSTTTVDDVAAVQQVSDQPRLKRSELAAIRNLDPGFSLVVFEDFAYLLYAAVQRARATGTQPILAYLAPNLAQILVDPKLADVSGIVIGAMRYVRFSGTAGATLEIELEIESNYVEVSRSGGSHRYYAVDRMTLTRSASARSRPAATTSTDSVHAQVGTNSQRRLNGLNPPSSRPKAGRQ